MSGVVPVGAAPHVLHVSQPGDGGVGQVVMALVRAQRMSRWPVTVACPAGTALAEWAAALGDVQILPWPARRAPGPATVTEVARLRRVLVRTRPDLVHLHSAKAGLAGRLVVRGRLATVYSPHGWSFHSTDGPLRSLVVAWERAAGRRWSDRVLCVSADERRTGERAGIAATWEVVPNGIDVALFSSNGSARRRARAELGVDPEDPLVVCVGRLCKAKGQDRLLAAWPAVRNGVPRARLALVGDGGWAARLGASALPGVSFVGPAAPRAWYAAADVVVVPSRWEGMALAPLEAMASGRTVVAFDVDGLPEVLREHDAVVPQGNVSALADAITKRLGSPDLRQLEGDDNRRAVRRDHDLATSTSGTMSVYQRVLAERSD